MSCLQEGASWPGAGESLVLTLKASGDLFQNGVTTSKGREKDTSCWKHSEDLAAAGEEFTNLRAKTSSQAGLFSCMAGSPLQDAARTVTRILQALASNQVLFEDNLESSIGHGTAIDKFIQQDYPDMEVRIDSDDLQCV